MLKSVRRLGGTPIVVALVCVLALGGTATAAKLITGKSVKNGSLTGKDIKNRSVKSVDLSKGARSSLRGPKGAKGDTGAAGATGATGAAGAAGLTGPPSGWMGKATGLDNVTDTTEYGYVSAPSAADADVSDRALLVPAVELRATRLTVLLDAQPGGLTSRRFVLRVNGTDTALACTVLGSAISCSSDTAVTIPAGAQVVLKTVTNQLGAAPAAADALYSITLERA